mgnify:CR=1 FL=1|jgi:hypothetical protein|tara:strand:- start:161 stop:319 length:159 start_codon:yes stop_codon:yes gene_type:complete
MIVDYIYGNESCEKVMNLALSSVELEIYNLFIYIYFAKTLKVKDTYQQDSEN